eukprot:1161413-Pelagomonas_calceolata.AAC.5
MSVQRGSGMSAAKFNEAYSLSAYAKGRWTSGGEEKTVCSLPLCSKLARELHVQSIKCAHKLVTTRCAIENKNNPHSQVLEPGASSNSPDPH